MKRLKLIKKSMLKKGKKCEFELEGRWVEVFMQVDKQKIRVVYDPLFKIYPDLDTAKSVIGKMISGKGIVDKGWKRL